MEGDNGMGQRERGQIGIDNHSVKDECNVNGEGGWGRGKEVKGGIVMAVQGHLKGFTPRFIPGI